MFPCARVNAVSILFLGKGAFSPVPKYWHFASTTCRQCLQLAYRVYLGHTASTWGRPRLQTTDHHAHVHGQTMLADHFGGKGAFRPVRGRRGGGGQSSHGPYIYYYTPLPLNLANNKQQQATSNNNNNTSPCRFGHCSVPTLRIICPCSHLGA